MKISWLGHSAFKLTESTGTTIVTDPYHPSSVGYSMKNVAADAVTISHQHDDHNCLNNITSEPEIFNTIGSFEYKGVHISSIKSYHDSSKGKKRGENLIFKFRMDGVELCHLGDIGEECSPLIAEAIGSVNVLLIPVGGNYTINAQQAYEYVDLLMPDIVIPMHYHTDNCKIDIDDLDEFVEMFDSDDIVYINQEEVELDRAMFDGERTKVYVMKL